MARLACLLLVPAAARAQQPSPLCTTAAAAVDVTVGDTTAPVSLPHDVFAAAWGAPTSELVATKRWRPRANVVFAARLNRSAAVHPQPGLPER